MPTSGGEGKSSVKVKAKSITINAWLKTLRQKSIWQLRGKQCFRVDVSGKL